MDPLTRTPIQAATMTVREHEDEWHAQRQEVCDDRDLGFIDSWACAERLAALRAYYVPLLAERQRRGPARIPSWSASDELF